MIFGTDVPGTVAVCSNLSTFPVYCLQYGGISVQQKHTAMVLWLFSPISSEEKTTWAEIIVQHHTGEKQISFHAFLKKPAVHNSGLNSGGGSRTGSLLARKRLPLGPVPSLDPVSTVNRVATGEIEYSILQHLISIIPPLHPAYTQK